MIVEDSYGNTEPNVMDDIIKKLRFVQKKYENKFIGTGEVNISGLARDCADYIEEHAVVHGVWIYEGCDYKCSICGHWKGNYFGAEGNTNYCPNCGAKMDGAK